MGNTLRLRLACFFFPLCTLELLFLSAGVQAQCVLSTGNPKAQPLDVRNILAQAASAASTLPDNFDKAEMYQAIARILWKQGDTNQGALFFDCAITVAAKSPPDRVLGEIPLRSGPFYLTELISDRARAGDFSGALGHVQDFSDPKLKNLAVWDISIAAGQQGKFALGQRIAQSIPDTGTRDAAFEDLALRSREAEEFVFSEKITRAIQNDVDRIKALADLALALGQKDKRDQASVLFAEAVRIAETLPSDDEKQHSIGALHLSLIFYNTRDSMLGYVASRQALSSDSSGANDTLSRILSAGALEESKRGIAGNALRKASSRTAPEKSGSALTSETVPESREPDEAAKELANSRNYAGALALASSVDPVLRNRFFEEIAQIQVQNGDAAQALEWTGRLDTAPRVSTLIAIAEALADSQPSSDNPNH